MGKLFYFATPYLGMTGEAKDRSVYNPSFITPLFDTNRKYKEGDFYDIPNEQKELKDNLRLLEFGSGLYLSEDIEMCHQYMLQTSYIQRTRLLKCEEWNNSDIVKTYRFLDKDKVLELASKDKSKFGYDLHNYLKLILVGYDVHTFRVDTSSFDCNNITSNLGLLAQLCYTCLHYRDKDFFYRPNCDMTYGPLIGDYWDVNSFNILTKYAKTYGKFYDECIINKSKYRQLAVHKDISMSYEGVERYSLREENAYGR